MTKKETYSERLKKVREKILSPITLSELRKEKRLYYERTVDGTDAIEIDGDIIPPFEPANPYKEYKKWLGVLGGLYAGAGLARSVVKQYLMEENTEIEEYIKSIDIDTSSAMGDQSGDTEFAIFDHYCYPYDSVDNVIITVNLDLIPSGGGSHDLKTFYEKEWHPTKNGVLFPNHPNILPQKKYWWMCSNGHEWSSSIHSRIQGGLSCPVCTMTPVIEHFDDYLIIDSVSKKIASDFYVSKDQISLKINQTRSREGKFEFLAQKRLTLLKKQFESLGKLSNKRNYKYSNENWMPIKNQIFEEVAKLTEKFESIDEAKSFIDMVRMYNDEELQKMIKILNKLQNKVDTNEALGKESRKKK